MATTMRYEFSNKAQKRSEMKKALVEGALNVTAGIVMAPIAGAIVVGSNTIKTAVELGEVMMIAPKQVIESGKKIIKVAKTKVVTAEVEAETKDPIMEELMNIKTFEDYKKVTDKIIAAVNE